MPKIRRFDGDEINVTAKVAWEVCGEVQIQLYGRDRYDRYHANTFVKSNRQGDLLSIYSVCPLSGIEMYADTKELSPQQEVFIKECLAEALASAPAKVGSES